MTDPPAITDPTRQAVGGIRVSTDLQEDRWGPARQRRDIEREAAFAGLELVHWHQEAVSGAKLARYTDNTYYDLARAHPGLNFIFSAGNRVGRHVEIIVGIARELLKLKAGVWVAGVGDLRKPRNWKEFLRDAVDAENEYTTIVQQLTDGKRDKAQQGGWAQGRAPWGYRITRDDRGVSTGLEIEEVAAVTVRRVFDLYAEHGGNRLTARQLNTEGLTTATGQAWTESAVAALIRNARYTGRAEFYGHVITFPPIISPDLWRQVQGLIRTRRKGERRTPGVHMLTGLARCAVCGAAMSGSFSMGGRRGTGDYRYYRCWRSAQPRDRCEHRKYYPQASLEDAAWEAVTGFLSQPAQVTALMNAEPPAPDPAPRLAAIREEMANLLTRAARYNLPDDVVNAALGPLQAELSRLESAAPAPAPTLPPDLADTCAHLSRNLLSLDREAWRGVLRDLRVTLEVAPGGVVRVAGLSLPTA